MDASKLLKAKEALDIVNDHSADRYLQSALDTIRESALKRKTSVKMWLIPSTINSLKSPQFGYKMDIMNQSEEHHGHCFYVVRVKWGPDPEPTMTPREKERAERIKVYLAECEKNGVRPHECSICDRICCDREH